MKKIYYLGLTVLTLLIFSCSEKKEKGFVTTFKGSIDGGDWVNINTIDYYGGNTGDCCSKVDSADQYSFGFCKLVSEISPNPIKKVEVSVYVKLADLVKKSVLVVSVIDKNNKNIFWEGRDLNPAVKEINKWYKFSTEVGLPDFENDGSKISIYVWNPNRNVTFVDDYEIRFLDK